MAHSSKRVPLEDCNDQGTIFVCPSDFVEGLYQCAHGACSSDSIRDWLIRGAPTLLAVEVAEQGFAMG